MSAFLNSPCRPALAEDCGDTLEELFGRTIVALRELAAATARLQLAQLSEREQLLQRALRRSETVATSGARRA